MSVNILSLLILFSAPFTGGLLALVMGRQKVEWVGLIISFSAAYLLGVTVLTFIPEVYSGDYHWAGIFVLIGFFLQIGLESWSKGLEHGHIHHHGEMPTFTLIAGLYVHAFLEGMPIGANIFSTKGYYSFLSGVALHEIPAAFALVSFISANNGTLRTILILCGYAMMAPLGALISSAVSTLEGSDNALHYLLALVIGTFLHVSTVILFEHSKNHAFPWRKLLAISLGVGIALLTSFLHAD